MLLALPLLPRPDTKRDLLTNKTSPKQKVLGSSALLATQPGSQQQQLEDAAVEEPSTAAPNTGRKTSSVTYLKN